MIKHVIIFMRYALALILTVGIVMASGSKALSHNPADLMQILTDHQAESADHGHVHEETVDVIHAYDGHAHDIAVPAEEGVADRSISQAHTRLTRHADFSSIHRRFGNLAALTLLRFANKPLPGSG